MGTIDVFVDGGILGIFAGVYYKTGIQADETGLAEIILTPICKTMQVAASKYNCWNLVNLVLCAGVLFSVASFIVSISKMKNWKLGVIVYFIGFLSIFIIFLLV